jgi:hypothetical protein
MQAVVEAVPIVGRAFRKAKRAIDASRLPTAVREVETLHHARGEILAETASKMAAGRIGGFTTLVVPRDDEFRKRYPKWKRVLLNLCRLRIAEAEKRLASILSEARARYEGYGCGDDEIEGDIIVRRARARIAGLQGRLMSIEGDPAEDVWQRSVGTLLADE